jgi:hypothetical protein
MLSNRLLVGALREHEEFDLEGRSMAALKDASASCSLTTIIGLQVRRKRPCFNPKIPYIFIGGYEDTSFRV